MVVRAASKESGNVLEIKAERPDWVGHVEGRTVSRRKTTEEIYRSSERRNNVNCREKRESTDRVGWGHMIGLWSVLKETTTRKSRRKQHIGSSSPNGTFYNIFRFLFFWPSSGFRTVIIGLMHAPNLGISIVTGRHRTRPQQQCERPGLHSKHSKLGAQQSFHQQPLVPAL